MGPALLEVAVDKHLIRRFDGRMARPLARAVHVGSGGRYESRMAARPAVRGTRFVPPAVPVNAGGKTAAVLEKALDSAPERALPDAVRQLRRSSARPGTVPADGESCPAGACRT